MSDLEFMTRSLLSTLLGVEAPHALSLSSKERCILEALGGRELYGLQIVAESAGGVGRGTVYVTLARMEEKGLVESRQEVAPAASRSLPRRLYRATGHGIRALRTYAAMKEAAIKAVKG